jgi:iron complex transport system ATP-binding protein
MIARTLAQDTDIILLEEPTAFLDLSNKYEILHILHRLACDRGKTILFSTHDLSTAIAECDKIWLMAGDQVIEGSPEDLVLRDSFNSLFTNKNLFFDAEKGDYRIVKETGEKAMVKGEGTPLNWTVKALERIGYDIISNLDPGAPYPVLKIEIFSSGWSLRDNGSEIKFDSLYALCRYLRNSRSR